jgi:hypothetical protein
MDGVLNEVTNTIHKHETGAPDHRTVCGATYHVAHDDLRVVAGVESALDGTNASKCGRCFDDGGSY